MSNCRFSGTIDEFEYDDRLYRIDVEATATAHHDPGCMYMKNGDPGYPPEDSFDIDEVDAEWYLIDEDDDSETEVEKTEEMNDALLEYLEEHDELFEFSEPDYEEPDYEEPDYDEDW